MEGPYLGESKTQFPLDHQLSCFDFVSTPSGILKLVPAPIL